MVSQAHLTDVDGPMQRLLPAPMGAMTWPRFLCPIVNPVLASQNRGDNFCRILG
jgi:hypothetical protein